MPSVKPVERRRRLFKKFASHLQYLKTNGFLPGTELRYDETYICPICLRQFCEADIEDNAPNMLTIEHAPPESSGGKGVVLTCKECNSTAGGEIDMHLVERLQEAERRHLLPNSSARIRVTSGDFTVQGELSVSDDNIITIRHDEKRNNPQKLEAFVDRVGPDTNPLVNIDFGKIQTDPHRMQIALLKTAYILAFAKFGYSFLLDGVYDSVRKQIQHPGQSIYPEGFWHKDHELFDKHEGVHFCETPIVEGIHCIFPVRTSIAIHYFGVHLPIPMTSPEVMIRFLRDLGPRSPLGNSFDLRPTLPAEDYLFDANRIRIVRKWFEDVRWSKINLSDSRNVPTALQYLRYPLTWRDTIPNFCFTNFRVFRASLR